MYLDYAEDQAEKGVPMTMQDRLYESDFDKVVKELMDGSGESD
jgi:hypothetical protein